MSDRHEKQERDSTSYILIGEQDFKTLLGHETDDHGFLKPELQEAFECRRNCVIAVPLYAAKGGPEWERAQGGAPLPASFLQDPDIVNFQGEKVLLYTLIFHDSDYEFAQFNQSNLQTLLYTLQTQAKKAASGFGVNRREAIMALLFGAATGLVGAATVSAFSKRQVQTALGDASAAAPPAPPPPPAPEVETAPENIKDLPGLAAVLASSLMHFEPDRRSLRDPLLRPQVVTEAFLDGRFRYTGQGKRQEQEFAGQRIHTFTVIGNRSSYYNAHGDDRFEDTRLSHAINTLLDYENLSDEEIKEWIVFNYKTAFKVTLEASRITLARSGTKEITGVTYAPPAGFENRMRISFAKPIEDQSPLQPGGNITTDTRLVPILAGDNRLLLQSGISPDHDLYVPEDLLDLDKSCTRPLGKDGGHGEIEISATDLARAIHRYHDILTQKQQKFVIPHTSDGQPLQVQLCSPYVDGTDPVLRNLARKLIPKGSTRAEAMELITGFVQSMPYVGENATDYHRPALLTVFNGGSDCNSLVELWSSLVTACKIPHGIFYFVRKDDTTKSHVTGAVPEALVKASSPVPETDRLLSALGIEIIPRPQLTIKGHKNQELTGPGFSPGDNAFSEDEMEVVAAEFLSFTKESTEPQIHVSLRGKTN